MMAKKKPNAFDDLVDRVQARVLKRLLAGEIAPADCDAEMERVMLDEVERQVYAEAGPDLRAALDDERRTKR